VAWPLRVRDEVFGVVVLHGREELESRQDDLVAMLDDIGGRLGQFVERERTPTPTRPKPPCTATASRS